jgi:adenylate cyclase
MKKGGAPMLKRLKYVSRFSHGMSPDDIAGLAAQAQENNSKLDITGILMTAGGLFFQVIEGPAENVNSLFHSIVSDKRHRDLLVLSSHEDAKTRLFPDWSMKSVDLDEDWDFRVEPLKALLETIVSQRDSIERLTDILERAVWELMVAKPST